MRTGNVLSMLSEASMRGRAQRKDICYWINKQKAGSCHMRRHHNEKTKKQKQAQVKYYILHRDASERHRIIHMESERTQEIS